MKYNLRLAGVSMERMRLNVFGGMVTDASVFVLLKRTNQAWTKREREKSKNSKESPFEGVAPFQLCWFWCNFSF